MTTTQSDYERRTRALELALSAHGLTFMRTQLSTNKSILETAKAFYEWLDSTETGPPSYGPQIVPIPNYQPPGHPLPNSSFPYRIGQGTTTAAAGGTTIYNFSNVFDPNGSVQGVKAFYEEKSESARALLDEKQWWVSYRDWTANNNVPPLTKSAFLFYLRALQQGII